MTGRTIMCSLWILLCQHLSLQSQPQPQPQQQWSTITLFYEFLDIGKSVCVCYVAWQTFLVCTRHSMLPNLKHYFIVNETTKESGKKSRKISSLFHLAYSIWAWKSRPLDYFRVLKLLNNNCNHLLKWKSIRMCLTQCSKSNNTLDRFRFLFQFFFRVVFTVSKTLR